MKPVAPTPGAPQGVHHECIRYQLLTVLGEHCSDHVGCGCECVGDQLCIDALLHLHGYSRGVLSRGVLRRGCSMVSCGMLLCGVL